MSAMRQVKRFIPFSVGPRDCIGQNLAKVNYQTTVPMLLSQFSFKLADEVSASTHSTLIFAFAFCFLLALTGIWLSVEGQ